MEHCVQDSAGNKDFKYSAQLTKLAHREQVEFVVELDDLNIYDSDLVAAVMGNTRRYTNIISDVVYDLLPTFKEREVVAKDPLDVYIEHRLMMENRMRLPNEQSNLRDKYPPELMRR